MAEKVRSTEVDYSSLLLNANINYCGSCFARQQQHCCVCCMPLNYHMINLLWFMSLRKCLNFSLHCADGGSQPGYRFWTNAGADSRQQHVDNDNWHVTPVPHHRGTHQLCEHQRTMHSYCEFVCSPRLAYERKKFVDFAKPHLNSTATLLKENLSTYSSSSYNWAQSQTAIFLRELTNHCIGPNVRRRRVSNSGWWTRETACCGQHFVKGAPTKTRLVVKTRVLT